MTIKNQYICNLCDNETDEPLSKEGWKRLKFNGGGSVPSFTFTDLLSREASEVIVCKKCLDTFASMLHPR